MTKQGLLVFFCMILVGCATTQRTMQELTPQENARLNQLLVLRDQCLVQEAARQDDGKSSLAEVAELVEWKCKHHYRQISSMLSDQFNIALSAAYGYRMQMEERSRKQIREAILTNRRMLQNNDPLEQLMRQ